jgi:hypothetical protein
MGAATRGVLVSVLVATPSFVLPSHAVGATEIIVLLALLAGFLTFAEYNSSYPSIVEFRDAPPLNRVRFVSLCVMFFVLTLVAKHQFAPSNLTTLMSGLSQFVGRAADFPFSPVRLVVLMMPDNTPLATLVTVRAAAGVAYVTALVSVGVFLIHLRVQNWPLGSGAFNVWINLPLFDPTTGGDVVARLQRDGRVNVALGALLPFLFPAVVKLAADYIGPMVLNNPHTLVWTISAWAFLPASMIMRGLAMLRIAELIEVKRRLAYANSKSVQTA